MGSPDSGVRRNGLLRTLRIPVGLLLVVVGAVLALPLVPGPGIPILLVGLAMLSDHFTWARKACEWIRNAAGRLRKRAHAFRGRAESRL